MRATAFALCLFMASPALADDICDPDKGTAMRVIGVAANDSLNLRAGPTAGDKLVATLAPGQVATSTGWAAQAKGQCHTTCQGAEGGLNDTGRSIAYGCKAAGKIWYQVRTAKGAVGWASGKYLEVGGHVAVPPIAELPKVERTYRFGCGGLGTMKVEVYRGGETADVTVGGTTHLVVKKPHALVPLSFAAGDGARLRGTARLVEWRWPDGSRVTCIGG